MTLPRGWVNCRLDDLLAPEAGALTDGPFGSSLKSEHYVDSGCRVIRLNNIGRGRFNNEDSVFIHLARADELRRHEARPGDLVSAALGNPLGRTCIVPDGIGPAIVKADCFRTRLDPRVDARLICYWLNSPALAAYFDRESKGVGRVRINTRVLRSAPLPLPPADRQRAIATHLEHVEVRADTARSEAAKAVKAAEALRLSGLRAGIMGELTARARAKGGFGETVDALLARVPAALQGGGGRAATETLMPGLGAISVNDPNTPLPDGWRWTPLLRVAAQGTGHTPSRKRDDYWNGDIPWLGIGDARDHHGKVVTDTIQHTTPAGLAGSSARLLPSGTVCLSRTASVGYVTILGVPMATSQDFVTWTCSEALEPEYLMYALMAEGRGIRRFGHGSTHTTIYMPELRAFYIALPPSDEQRLIVAQIGRILSRAEILLAAAADAVSTAEQLLPRAVAQAMEGKMDKDPAPGESATALLEALRRDRTAIQALPRAPRKPRVKKNGVRIGMNNRSTEKLVPRTAADLAALLGKGGGELSAASLWRQTGLEIDQFYRLLRDAVNDRLIAETDDKEVLRAS
jgi:type I restriction enzyme, S subunit